jgi:hypothetical protein
MHGRNRRRVVKRRKSTLDYHPERWEFEPNRVLDTTLGYGLIFMAIDILSISMEGCRAFSSSDRRCDAYETIQGTE